MDRLWTPWRYSYITKSGPSQRKGIPEPLNAYPDDQGCVFCNLIASVDYAIEHGMSVDEAERHGHIVTRGKFHYIALNAFPYTSGHVMVVPYLHTDALAKLDVESAHELITMAQQTERAIRATYRPDGLNFGLNLGEAAGAGVAAHLHLHGLPRWVGDNNFMPVLAETRILPEDLDVTWQRLRQAFQSL